MKKVVCCAVALFGFVITVSAAPQISCANTTYNFNVSNGVLAVEHSFVLTNTGDEDLVFGRVRSCCGSKSSLRDTAALVGEIVELTLSGSTTLSARANITLNVDGNSGSLDASGTLSNSDLVAAYKVEASVWGVDWTVCEDSYTFPDTANSVSVSGTLATFGG